jgi:hypothetical protein
MAVAPYCRRPLSTPSSLVWCKRFEYGIIVHHLFSVILEILENSL